MTIIVYWKDLDDNAFVTKDTVINMNGEGMNRVILRTALESLLEAMSAADLHDQLCSNRRCYKDCYQRLSADKFQDANL